MSLSFKKYPPVAADLPGREVLAAFLSRSPNIGCLAEVSRYLGVNHIFPVNSGRTALYAILKSSLPAGSKVVLPGYTCYTVAAAVVRAGMTPVLSDTDPENLGYDLPALEKTLARHGDIAAIVVCHLFGIAVDMEAIKRVAGDTILIVDDAAQGFGMQVRGRHLGTGGDCGFYSFGRGKNLYLGGGGLIVTDDDTLAEKLKRFVLEHLVPGRSSVFGMAGAMAYNTATHPVGFNLLSRLPGMHLGKSIYAPGFGTSTAPDATVRLLCRLYKTAEELNRHRSKTARRYCDLLAGKDGVTIPRSTVDGNPGNLRFPVLVRDPALRETLLSSPDGRKLGLSPMYPTALNGITGFPHRGGDELAGAELVARSIITLPTHRHISTDGNHSLADRIAGLFTRPSARTALHPGGAP